MFRRDTWSVRSVSESVVYSVWLIGLIVVQLMMVEAAPTPPEQCMDDEQRERVRGIILEGIEEALKNQVKHVFEMWMRDSEEQPKRAITGMHIGINAYVRSRASALKWSPPKCEEKK
jgi:hypothetical protein